MVSPGLYAPAKTPRTLFPAPEAFCFESINFPKVAALPVLEIVTASMVPPADAEPARNTALVGDEEEEPCLPLDCARSPKSSEFAKVDISIYCNSVGVPPPKIPLVDELFVPPF